MRIHTRFIVKNNLNVVCTLVAHFYKKEGAQLEGADLQGDYSTSDGHVVTYVKSHPVSVLPGIRIRLSSFHIGSFTLHSRALSPQVHRIFGTP